MSWKAYLRGPSIDIDVLIRLFPADSGDLVVARNERGAYLETAQLDHLTDAGELHSEAEQGLQHINGLGRVLDGSYRPVQLAGTFEDETGHNSHVVLADTIEARVSIVATGSVTSGGVELSAPTPPGPRLFALASSTPDVSEALSLIGRASLLDWVDLYKVYEVVRDHVGDGQAGLVNAGWISGAELSAFTASANRPDVSGGDARHARMAGKQPSNTMSLPVARDLIRRLVTHWMEAVASR